MKKILIKPHHFIDIIKLYGSGIEEFVPDQKMGHDFYKVANDIIHNPTVILNLTLLGDDICKPCKQYHGKCIDGLTHIPGYTCKDDYNVTLDQRIIELYHLKEEEYSALRLCEIILEGKENIFQVWREEDNGVTNKRYELFVKGANKLLQRVSV